MVTSDIIGVVLLVFSVGLLFWSIWNSPACKALREFDEKMNKQFGPKR